MSKTSIHDEKQMALAVSRHLGNSATEITVGRCRFDVVAYDKKVRLFKVVECKRVNDATRIGQTFGQVGAYRGVLEGQAFKFVDAFSKKVHMRFGRWMEATQWGLQIRVEFYVALTREACKKVELLRSIKHRLPDVGVMRVRPEGSVSTFIRDGRKKDYELAKAHPAVIRIVAPTSFVASNN